MRTSRGCVLERAGRGDLRGRTRSTIRRVLPVVLVLALVVPMAAFGAADEAGDPTVLVFFEAGCHSCELVEELLAELAVDLPPSAIRRYEISEPGAIELLSALAAAYEVEADTVPVVFVGEEVVIGAGRSAEFGLRAAIGDCVVRGCVTPLDRIRPPPFPWSDVLRLGAFAALLLVLLMLQPL
jgi:hypothetical protein